MIKWPSPSNLGSLFEMMFAYIFSVIRAVQSNEEGLDGRITALEDEGYTFSIDLSTGDLMYERRT